MEKYGFAQKETGVECARAFMTSGAHPRGRTVISDRLGAGRLRRSLTSVGTLNPLAQPQQCSISTEHFHDFKEPWARGSPCQRNSHRLRQLAHLDTFLLNHFLEGVLPF